MPDPVYLRGDIQFIDFLIVTASISSATFAFLDFSCLHLLNTIGTMQDHAKLQQIFKVEILLQNVFKLVSC